MGVSLKNMRDAIINIFTLIGYSEKMIPYLYYISISEQFIWLYILIILNQNTELNTILTAINQVILHTFRKFLYL
jgi:hypothetical protein